MSTNTAIQYPGLKLSISVLRDVVRSSSRLEITNLSAQYVGLCGTMTNPNRSGAIMAVCPIHSVAEVWWYPTKEKAFQEESRHAIEFRNKRPGEYVSQA